MMAIIGGAVLGGALAGLGWLGWLGWLGIVRAYRLTGGKL